MSKPPSLAEEFFRRIKSQADPAAFLTQVADPSSSPTFESDYLDFKCRPVNDSKNAQLKDIWYTALSGFANSGGGVLIWGIDARKDKDTGIDAACGIQPVQDPVAFKSLLTELQRGATDPPLGNVEIEAWETNAGEGLVGCFVPSGPFKPYRAEVSGRKQFWLRAGDSFIVPSVALIRALLTPHPIAVFKVTAELDSQPDPAFVRAFEPRKIQTNVLVQVENAGMGTGKQPHVEIDFLVNGSDHEQLREEAQWEIIAKGIRPSGEHFVVLDRNLPIHPGVKLPIVQIGFETPAGRMRSPPIRLVFRFFAENQSVQTAVISFPACPWGESSRFTYEDSAVGSE